MKVNVEIELGKESCAIATLLLRAAHMIREQHLDGWYEYADAADTFRRKLDKVIWEASQPKPVDKE